MVLNRKTHDDNGKSYLSTGRKDAPVGIGVYVGHRSVTVFCCSGSQLAPDKPVKFNEFLFSDFDLEEVTPSFLKYCLNEVCGKYSRTYSIWTALKEESVVVRQLSLPSSDFVNIGKAAYWKLHKEYPFDDSEYIFDVEPVSTSADGKNVTVNVCLAKRDDVIAFKKLFLDAGYDLTGITLSGTAVSSYVHQGYVKERGSNTLLIHTGDSASTITIYSDGREVLRRNLKTGVDDLLNSFIAESKCPASEAYELFRAKIYNDRIRAKDGLMFETKEAIDFFGDSWIKITRRLEDTMNYYRSNINDESLDEILVSGDVACSDLLISDWNDYFDTPVSAINPFNVASEKSKKKTVIPDHPGSFLHAAQLAACGHDTTMNLIFPFNEKIDYRRIRKISRMVGSISALILAFLCCVGYWLWNSYEDKEQQNKILRDEFKLLTTQECNEDVIREMTVLHEETLHKIQNASKKLLPVYLINFVASSLPNNAYLSQFEKEDGKDIYRVKGWFVGDTSITRTQLVDFLLRIKRSYFIDEIEQVDDKNRSGRLQFELLLTISSAELEARDAK